MLRGPLQSSQCPAIPKTSSFGLSQSSRNRYLRFCNLEDCNWIQDFRQSWGNSDGLRSDWTYIAHMPIVIWDIRSEPWPDLRYSWHGRLMCQYVLVIPQSFCNPKSQCNHSAILDTGNCNPVVREQEGCLGLKYWTICKSKLYGHTFSFRGCNGLYKDCIRIVEFTVTLIFKF